MRARTAVLATFVLLATSLTGVSVPLVAQEVTGALQGRVMLADNAPAAGALLSLTGANLQGARTRQADATGFYQFLALPPGEYALRVSRIGARPVTVERIVVGLGKTTGLAAVELIGAAMQMEGVRIEASRYAVDPVRTTAGGTIVAADFANLPTARDYKSAISILPQVNASYRGDPPNVAGSTGIENQYFIDGVNVSDPRDGMRATALPYNFVRAVEVKAGGYEARYGRALGAVVNAVTYSGTNAFEVSTFAFSEPDALSMTRKAMPNVTAGEESSYDVGVRVGGPLRKDQLWYSAAFNPRRSTVTRDVAGLGRFADRTSALVFAGKLTWRASAKANVEFSLFGDPTERDGALEQSSYEPLSVDHLLVRIKSGGQVASLRATFSPSDRLLIEATLAGQWDRASALPKTERGDEEDHFIDDVAQQEGGGVGFSTIDRRGRRTAAVHVTRTFDRHTTVFGVEIDDLANKSRSRNANAGTVVRYDTDAWLRDVQSYSGTFHNRSPAAYLQDSWRPTDRLTLNAGLRWSGQYMTGASGRVAQRISDEWQPRAGFSWLLDDGQRQRVFGSYGRYYQLLTTNIAALWFVDYRCKISYYGSDPRIAGAIVQDSVDCGSLESDYATQIPGLEAENFDEFTLGYERMLGARAKLTMRGMRRALRSSFQWGFNKDADPVWAFGTPGKGNFDFLPPPKREYTGLEVSAEGVAGPVQYRASYVLSRTWGNYPGLYNSDFAASNPGLASGFWSPNQAVNSTGYLPTDRRHIAKVSGSWTSDFGLTVGAFLTSETGTPINDFESGGAAGGPTFLVERGSAGRTPALWNVDLRLAYDVPRRRGATIRVLADLLHVGNVQGITRVDEMHYTTPGESGTPGQLNERYRKPLGFQPPMAVRVGLEVKF